MDEGKFWDIIAELNWLENCHKRKEELVGLQLRLAHKYKRPEISDVHQIAGAKAVALSQKIRRYLVDNKKSKLPYSNNAFADLCDHAVGLGKDFYEKALADPSVLEKLDGYRSFAYVLPGLSEYSVFVDGYFEQQTEIFCKNVFEKIEEHPCSDRFDGSLDVIKDIIAQLKAGNLDKLPKAELVLEFWANLQKQAEKFGLASDDPIRGSLKKNGYLAALVREANILCEIKG